MSGNNFTHKGWIGFCPVLVGDLESGGPIVKARPGFGWLMPISDALQGAAFTLLSAIDPNYQPMWPIRITGRLK